MSFADVITSQRRPAVRPSTPENLLIHPITANPHDPAARMDADWAKEHAGKQRFYVGGVRWFSGVTQLSTETISTYKDQAPDAAKESNWNKMPGTPLDVVKDLRSQWGAVARPQFFSVTQARAVNFPKAALFLLACELALHELIAQSNRIGRMSLPPGITTGAVIYQNMAIVPACWNVNDFNSKYHTKHFQDNASLLQNLADHAGQTNVDVLLHLASGYTVTFDTAHKVRDFCMHPSNGCDEVGKLRSRAGKSTLGTNKASHLEDIEL